MTIDVRHFFHADSGTLSYVISDPATGSAAVIDPVLGFSVVSGRTDTAMIDLIVAYIDENKLEVEWILETHAHADHLSGAQFIRARTGGKIAIGEGIKAVQAHFAPLFNLSPAFVADGSDFDHLFGDGEEFRIGAMTCRVMHTPGHTSDNVSYLVGDHAFIGDSLFMTDFGTARCDFPGGDAGLLFDSIQKIYALPDSTQLYLCHDYPPADRSLIACTTVAEQKQQNLHIKAATGKAEFIALREERDASLSLPALLLPALQVNIRAGRLPEKDGNGFSCLRIPLNAI